jgi:hypothetical protein
MSNTSLTGGDRNIIDDVLLGTAKVVLVIRHGAVR